MREASFAFVFVICGFGNLFFVVRGRDRMKDIELINAKYDWIISLVAGICGLFVLIAGLSSNFKDIKEDWMVFLMLTVATLANFRNCYRQYKNTRKTE